MKIKNELDVFKKEYHKMVFRNKDSLISLKKMYEKLRDHRQAIIESSPGFPKDTELDIFIENLQKDIFNTAPRRSLEWSFYHYNDLFIFKVGDLLGNIEKEFN
ncbi:MAG: hypothetical protein QM737_15290 [Ferruginibacter sp.]